MEDTYDDTTGKYDGIYVLQPLYGMKKIPKIGEWIKSKDLIIEGNCCDKSYTSGFHIFTNQEDAKQYQDSYTVFLVEFCDIVAVGKQSDNDIGLTVVAKRMKLLRKISTDIL